MPTRPNIPQPGRRRTWLALAAGAALVTASAAPAAVGPVPPPALDRRVDAPASARTPAPVWSDDLDASLRVALTDYRPVFVLFTSPGCHWCRRLKEEVFVEPAVRALLARYVCVEIDVTRQQMLAMRYGVQGVPAVRILASDGRPHAGFAGYQPAPLLRQWLEEGLGEGAGAAIGDAGFDRLMAALRGGKVEPALWEPILRAYGTKALSDEVREQIVALKPPPRADLVRALDRPQLALRLAALEILEELAGENHGFDPWIEPGAPANAEPLAKWRLWAEGDAAPRDAAPAPPDAERLRAHLRDIVSDDRDRAVRATQMLLRAGPAAALAGRRFLEDSAGLAEGARMRIREVIYAVSLPRVAGSDPSATAHRLVFGNLDTRIAAVAELQGLGRDAVPVLRDFIRDRDPIVRETAADTLAGAAGVAALPLIEDALKDERDAAVVHAFLRTVARIGDAGGIAILEPYGSSPQEDHAIAAIEGLGTLRAARSEKTIRAALADARWRVRAAAVEAAGKASLRGLGAPILELTNDPDEFVRRLAVGASATLAAPGAAERLKAKFIAEPALRAAVTEALSALNQPLPAEAVTALAAGDVSDALAVCDAADSAALAVPLGLALRASPNADLRAAALRLLAAKGTARPEVRAALAESLRGGDRGEQMAVLENLRFDNDQLEGLGANGPAGGGILSSIVGAFLRAPKPDPAASPRTPPTSVADLFQAIHPLLASADFDLRQQAALALLQRGDPDATTALVDGLENKPPAWREAIADRLEHASGPKVETLFRALLRDSAADTREAAARTAFETGAERTEWVFEELVRSGGLLQPAEVVSYRMQSMQGAPRERAAILSRWGRRLALQQPPDPPRRVLGLICLELAWQPEDAVVVRDRLSDEDPFVRRAAFHALAVRDPAGFEKELPRLLGDASEVVRGVLPPVVSKGAVPYVHRFDSAQTASGSGDAGSRRAPSTSLLEALRTLASDPSATVRADAFFALIEHRQEIDYAAFVSTLRVLPDQRMVRSRVTEFLTDRETVPRPEHRALLPFLEPDRYNAKDVARVRSQLDGGKPAAGSAAPKGTGEADTYGATRERAPAEPTAPGVAPAQEAPLWMVVYYSPGCGECARVDRVLRELEASFPRLKIERRNLRDVESMRTNEALGARFDVPAPARLVAPSIFMSGGALVRDGIDHARLGELIARSEPGTAWMEIGDAVQEGATAGIEERYRGMRAGVVFAAGLLDGINPCAFATIVFLLSYLQIARRTTAQLAAVGATFVLSVFLTYFLLGLGLAQIVARLSLLRGAGLALNWLLAGMALLFAVLSLRDAILCMRGRADAMALQLPAFLKTRIHSVIREGARQPRYLLAAFGAGMTVSVLELACTGQVYAPTILYMLQTGHRGAAGYLLLYNAAFVTPLVVVFLLALFGVSSQRLAGWQKRNLALVKFAIAALFLALFLLLVAGGRLLPAVNP